MKRRHLLVVLAASPLIAMGIAADPSAPAVITPGACESGDCFQAPPSDAIVLFDGTSVDAWTTQDGKPAGWKASGKRGGSMVTVPNSGSIVSKEKFNDAQIHVEFKTPVEQGEGQDRGNSGVYLQGRYEVQILDSFKNETYPDGQCGAIYKQHIPLINACRPQGEWQTYDIVFRAAKFGADGKMTTPASVTVLHNGVLIHDHAQTKGTTGAALSVESPEPGPMLLQDHGHKLEFRNIWIRKLGDK